MIISCSYMDSSGCLIDYAWSHYVVDILNFRFVVALFSLGSVTASNRTGDERLPLRIGLLLPLAGSSSYNLPQSREGCDMALRHINSNSEFLPGYELKFDLKNASVSECCVKLFRSECVWVPVHTNKYKTNCDSRCGLLILCKRKHALARMFRHTYLLISC
jgi:hypothetical protein